MKRRITLQFQGVGAHPLDPWASECTCAVYRFSCNQIPAEFQWRLQTKISGKGLWAYQLVFGPNRVERLRWGDDDEDLQFARDTSASR